MPQQLWVLTLAYVDDVLEARKPHRAGHLELLQRLHETGDCVLGGAVGDPPFSGLIVFASREAAERFVAEDPYLANGVATGFTLEPWTEVVAAGT